MSIVYVGVAVSAVLLVVIGVILLNHWKRQLTESLFYWGFGLLLWGISLVLEYLLLTQLLSSTPTLLFIRHYLQDLAFVFFILYGTLLLVLKKKHANLITGGYFLVFFLVTIVLGGITDNRTTLSVWHNILFITPTALVSGIYYFYYHRKLRKAITFVIYNMWILFAILAYLYTFMVSVGLVSESALDGRQIASSVVVSLLAISYLLLILKEHETWQSLTQAVPYVISDQLKAFFEEHFFDRAELIIKTEMDHLNLSNLESASRLERRNFIENCLANHFSKIMSLQRQEIVRAKLLSILGVRLDSSEGKNLGYNQQQL